jgi:N-methylhydantoinase A
MWRIGIDVGGTFTDVVAVEGESGRLAVVKVASTPDDQSEGVLAGIHAVLERAGITAGDVGFLAHGTTVATNGFLERRGALTALVTTDGFRDMLEFRRGDRAGVMDPYDLHLSFPQPLVRRANRFEVVERIDARGEVVTPLDDASLRAVIEALREMGAHAVAISLLFSFVNPAHERAVARAVVEALPETYVTCSSDVDPQAMEYERTSTTVVNAYLGPLVAGYLSMLERRVEASGLPPVHVMQSHGGLVRTATAVDLPAALLASGPAGGMVAASQLVGEVDSEDAIVVDLGGTSFDVGLVVGGRPQRVASMDVDGHTIRLPMLDIRSIGAGGGSIARIDAGGTLRVGPRSAGSRPGPACYGRGGTLPTTTDADLLLGYFASDALLGGAMTLDRAAAERAVEEHVSRPLGMDRDTAAAGIVRIIDAAMADAIRVLVTHRGLDPRDFVLVAAGGAGPLHAGRVARELGIRRILVPLHPGTFSAVGLTRTDIVHDRVASALLPLPGSDPADLERRFASLESSVIDTFRRDGIAVERVELQRAFQLRYFGQQHDISVSVPAPCDESALQAALDDFHARHEASYRFSDPNELVMAVTLQVTGRASTPRAPEPAARPSGGNPVIGRQRGFFPETGGWFEAIVLDRAAMVPGVSMEGPALIPQSDASTLVLPGQKVTALASGALLVEDT